MELLNKYKHLVKNTFIFAIGTFSSKILVFVLMPIYTRTLTTEQYGIVDLVVQTANLLFPLVTLGMTNAIIRFGVDRSYRKNDVFTAGLLATLLGFAAFLCFSPLLGFIQGIGDHIWLLIIYVFTSCIKSLSSTFVRSKGCTKLYAFDGFLSTLVNCTLTILFLVGFKWEITGYLLAIILADVLSILFLFFAGDLLRNIRIRGMSLPTAVAMLKYALPMIPTNVFWWVVATSDRYIIAFMISEAANGLYAASYKVPTILMLVSSIFMDAWQVSAIKEHKQKDRAQFFSQIFNAFQSVMFLSSAWLIPFSKIFTMILVSESYYASWQFIPFLILANAFCCMVNFIGSVYMVEKRSIATLVTTIIGAAANVGMNFAFIPLFSTDANPIGGAQGAAIATFLSYFLVFVIRVIHTRQFIRIRFNILKFGLNTTLITLQAILMITEVPLWILYQILLTAALTALNGGALFKSMRKILNKRKHKTRRA